jgi:hypothetical protein
MMTRLHRHVDKPDVGSFAPMQPLHTVSIATLRQWMWLPPFTSIVAPVM